MKPGDHPEFFRMAAPPGTSRESSIRLDADGRFWHDGQPVDHDALAAALHSWIATHPEDGRFILTNGYDWTYFQVDDAPYVVRTLREQNGEPWLRLSDGTEEALDPTTLTVGDGDALYAQVKRGKYEARFSRHAQLALAPWVVPADDRDASGSGACIGVGGHTFALRARVGAASRSEPP